MTASLLFPLLLSAVMLWSAGLALVGPRFIREAFAHWGYSDGLRITVGVTELVAAIALLFAPYRIVGCALAVVILLGVIVTFVRDRTLMRVEYPLVLLVFTLIIAAQTSGLIR